MLDASRFKEIVVSRTPLKYHYYYSPAASGKPTLLFLHGFPSTAHDWNRQINYFQPKGYGILAPDMLGFGGTSRPADVEYFKMSGMAADIIEILDNEKLGKVIGVAHDWGSAVMSRLAQVYGDRFLAYGWIALSYVPPISFAAASDDKADYYARTAYWEFFLSPDAAATIEKNVDSFIQLLYAKNPDTWMESMCTRGKTVEWIQQNNQPGFAEYMTDEEIDVIRKGILDGGIQSSMNYYLAEVKDVNKEDNQRIAASGDFSIAQPSFYAAALRDPVCAPVIFKEVAKAFLKDLTVCDYDAGHWPQFQSDVKLNYEFEAWLNTKGF